MGSLLSRSRVIAFAALLSSMSASAAQTPAQSPFVGRWEVSLQAPKGETLPSGGDKMVLFIIDIAASRDGLSAKFVDVAAGPLAAVRIQEISSNDDQLKLVIELAMGKLVFNGKRVNDRLEGTAAPDADAAQAHWIGVSTTKDSLQSVDPAGGPISEGKAYATALTKPPAVRANALKQFLKDFPDSSMKDQATLQLALSYQDRAERQSALRSFVKDFPDSFLKDNASYQLALSESNISDRVAALQKFAADFPASSYRQQAQYLLATSLLTGAEREAAQQQFLKAYPTSANSAAIYRSLWETYLNQTPVDEAKLGAAIDGFITATESNFSPAGRDGTINSRAAAMNTVADQLMTKGVMLDKALDVIERAITTAGKTESARTRAMFTTTLGQVLFKLNDFSRAEQELKHAIEIAGADGDGEAWLFLGKIDEARHDEDAALEAYLKATADGSPLDTKPSLERLYLKKHGSLATLDDKLDAIELARPKPFDAGHFTRTSAASPQRIVLAELFTGAECDPCVAADIAFDGLSARYDTDTVAILVYHLHVPGPDPMTNPDTEARGEYYKVHGTPTALIDGGAAGVGGGGAAAAGILFSGYTKKIEARLDTGALATLTNFHAATTGQTITVSGDVELTPQADAVEKATLHIALVQDLVRYAGSNGVRRHTFVVRELVGSAAGTPLQKPGKRTHVSEAIDVSVVAQSLDAYLQGYETKTKPAGFKFHERADNLDARHFSIVAFVQDEKTKEILQAILIKPGT